MFLIRMAEIVIAIDNRYDHVLQLCKQYICKENLVPDLTVAASVEEIEKEMSASDSSVSPGYAESICIYRNICVQLPLSFEAFLFHSAVIEYEGRGYVFAAKSGTGKSTHISLWRKRFGDKVHVVNGDKPIFRFQNDTLYAYGTPWCGKEGWQTNTQVEICGICFLERGEINEIAQLSAAQVLSRFFDQILLPTDVLSVDKLFPLIDRTLSRIPCYRLKCNISEQAAEVAYDGMCCS